MSSIAIARPAVPASHRATLTQLAVLEMRRYARHPLFLVGTLITVASCVSRPDHRTGSYFDAIVPAAALGVVGLVAMASLTRNSHKLSTSAGAPPVPEWTQTAALALAALVPFLVGIAWFAWAVWAAGHWPAPPGGFPFGPVGEGWKLAWLFALGALPALGGPLLGLVIGRWLPQRGVAPLAAVLLVAATILMQGLFEPLRAITIGYLTEPLPRPNGSDHPDLKARLAALAEVDASNFDRLISFEPLIAETADSDNISHFAVRLSGSVSVGLNAIEFVNET